MPRHPLHRNAITRSLAAALSLIAASPAAAQTAARTGPLDEILITGSPITRDPFDLLQGSSILQDREFERAQATTLGETLTGLPGVNSNYFAPGASRPVIRGLGEGRVRVLVNGLGAFDAATASPDHAVAADTLTTDKVEVIRGPSTLLYGSNASGGVVNVIDRRLPNRLPEGGLEAGLSAHYGTAADEAAVAGSIDAALGPKIAFHADAAYRNSGNLDIPGFAESARLRALEEAEEDDHDSDHDVDHDVDHENEGEEEAFGTLPNSDVESWSGSAGASYIGERGFFGFSVSGLESDYGVGDGHEHDHGHENEGEEEEEEEEEEGPIRIDLKQIRFDFAAAREFDGPIARAELRLGYADYRHFEKAGDEIETRFDNEAWEGRLELQQQPIGKLQGAYGFQFQARDFGAVGAEAFIAPTETLQWGLFAVQKFEFDKLHVEYGGRFERQTVENSVTSVKRGFSGFSGSAGLAFHPSDSYLLGLNVSRTERLPIAEELFAEGPHFATGAFELGDDSLKSERGWTVEGTMRKRAGRVTASVNLFYTDYNNFIFLDPTGDEEDGLPVFAYSQSGAEFYGGEAALEVAVWQRGDQALSIDAAADLVRASNAGGALPRIPPMRLMGGVDYRHGPVEARVEARWVDSQNRVTDFELPTDSYTLLNVHIDFTPFENKAVSIGFSGRNLLDKDARNHVSFRKDITPMPGRDFQVRLKMRI